MTRPFAYAASRTFATRFLHTLLRGVSLDRLDLLGEEYFQYVLKPQIRKEASEKLLDMVRRGERVVLVSQLLDHIMRPLARHFGIDAFVANRLEFRDGAATGRLLDPVVRPRGPFAWLSGGSRNGQISEDKLVRRLGWADSAQLKSTILMAGRPAPLTDNSVVTFGDVPRVDRLSVRETLANRHILLIGVTGFIGKVWLVDLLENVPDIGKVTLLIRQKSHHLGATTI